jgi:adenosylhomocysteine nucleosidase
MKILIIDDEETKAEAIKRAIDGTLDSFQSRFISIADSLSNAIRLVSVIKFDLIVLDLMLPYLSRGTPDARAGLELLRQLRSESGPNSSTTVIGLSAFPEEILDSRARFEELGVLITKFDLDGAWAKTVARYVSEVKGRIGTRIDVDFVIVCALEEERIGYLNTGLRKISEAIVSGLNIHYVDTADGLFGCIVRLGQMGLVCATFETALALSIFRANVICMTGVCAGLSDRVELGQLVIGSPAWEYQAGKWSANGFEIAPMQIPLKPSTRATIDQVIGNDQFIKALEEGLPTGASRPKRLVKPALAPFATGSAVIADEPRLRHIEQQHRKLAAIDMETYGLYFAAHQNEFSNQHFFSIKCVVDLADEDKSDDLHPYGAVVSARAAEQIIRALVPTAQRGQ